MTTKGLDLSVFRRADSANPSPAKLEVPRPRSRWKTRVLVPLLILLGAGALLGYAAREVIFPGTDVRTVPVVVVRAIGAATSQPSTAGGAVVAQAPGWVEPDPYAISVSALTEGVVADVLVLEGQAVKKGDVIARLVQDDAKLALERAEADFISCEAKCKAAKDRWENPIDRDRAVQVSEAMLADAKAELERFPRELDAAKALHKELEFDYETGSKLPESAISRLEVARSKYKAEAQAAAVRAMEGKLPSLEAKVRQNEAEAKAAKENRRLRIEETQAKRESDAIFKMATAVLNEAKLRLERTEVKAPIDGVIMARLVEPGSKIMFTGDMEHSAHVARLYDPKKLQVRVDVPLADAAKISVGQSARVTVDVLPDRTFEGTVVRAVHSADVQKNTQQFKVAIKDPAEEIKPEMLAKVKFLSRGNVASAAGPTETDVGGTVFAPQSLLNKEGNSHWALVYDARHHKAHRRIVVIGDAVRDGWIAIREGLSPGDRLIVADKPITDGQRVRVIGDADESQIAKADPAKGAGHVHD